MGFGVKAKLSIAVFLIVVGVCRGQDWPIPNSSLEALLTRSSRWNTLSSEKQAETRAKLIYALKLAGSLEAHKTFFNFIVSYPPHTPPANFPGIFVGGPGGASKFVLKKS